MNVIVRYQLLALLYFLLSAVITFVFIFKATALYHFNMDKMILSVAIAGAKWLVQIIAAYVLLGNRRWEFIYRIALVCLLGSCLLIPYAAWASYLSAKEFVASIIIAVLLMLYMYYLSVRGLGLPMKWYFLWVTCLAIAITLQLTVVF